MTARDLEILETDVKALATGGAVSAQSVGQRINNYARQIYREFKGLQSQQDKLKKIAAAYCAHMNTIHAKDAEEQEAKG